jgi:type I restriction enzyme S subunit
MKTNQLQKNTLESWSSYKVDQVCTLVTNGFVGTATTHYTNESDGILYIQGYNITEGGFNFSGIKKVNNEFHKKNSKSCLKFKDLLTIQTGDCGLTSIVSKELEGANCHALIISRFKPELVNSYFVYYFYNSEIGRSKLKRIETGSTMKHINVSDLKDIELSIPTLSEQNRIVSVLETWDKSIEKFVQKIETKKQIKKGLMQDLLTGKKRSTGFKDKWTNIKVGEIFSFLRTYAISRENLVNDTSNNQGIGNIHYGDIHSTYGSSSIDLRNISVPQIKDMDFKFDKNDLLINGDLIMADVSEDYEGIGTTVSLHKLTNKKILGGLHTFVLRDKSKKTTENYRQYIFQNEEVRNRLRKIANGVSVYGISKSNLSKMQINLPSIPEQIIIANILTTSDKEITELEKKLSIIKEQKRYLLNNLITGTIRTPETLSTK